MPESRPKEESYDEEAALASAIAASLQEAQPTATSHHVVEPEPAAVMLITPIERENVELFAELLNRMRPHDEELENPQFLQLANSMILLRERLQAAAGPHCTADISRIISTLDSALFEYERLSDHSYETKNIPPPPVNPYHFPDVGNVPTRPRSITGSITAVDTSRPSVPLAQPPPADIIPVLRPLSINERSRKEDTLIPDLDAEEVPQLPEVKEDPLAELVNDAPLIQL